MTEAKKSLKRTLIGKVVSDKRAKTVTVLVERRVKHELYGKIVAKSSKYHAHDEKGEYHTGDVIEITESRPISKTKNWVVTRLVEKAAAGLIPRRTQRNRESGPQCGPFFFFRSTHMIKVGDTLPAATLQEYSEVEGEGCSIGPNPVDVTKAAAGKTIALFALPGAFTPTCSAKHVPGYVQKFDELQGRGRRRDLVRERQRRLRHGRLGARPEDRRQGAHAGRRQRATSPRPPA